ncbi:protein MAINTENANCE OF MERISTEMS-like isoform X2 [Lotus japonicus]|uniref:protein MAINTENANCE OF MERISTEMS-like isoform X2 n=1 Tax=Lotus japonicus TaxID=34305 RepID=UPI00258CBB88|nr:protein MAINTENANCE OF MERISTEMS-like isoform X2 [Lotus japonicus]
MNITLEDVLFITGLLVYGKPVISDTSRDEDAFSSIFGINQTTVSIAKLKEIACGERSEDKKMYVVLLMVITCIVVPSEDGHRCCPSYVQFVKNLDDVNSYAWGAALLSFLYSGMRKYKSRDKKYFDGNAWVLLSFLLFHILKLQQELQIDLTMQPPTPVLFSAMNSLEKIGRDQYSTYVSKVTALLNSGCHGY